MDKLIREIRVTLRIATPDADPNGPQPPFTRLCDVDGIVVVRFLDLNAILIGMDNVDGIERASNELLSVADRNPLAMILDFEGTDFVPMAAFTNALIRLHKKLDGKLRMCNLRQSVVEIFLMIHLTTVFQIHADLGDALAAVKIPYLELPTLQRIPLVTDQALIGRIPFDEEKHEHAFVIAKEKARCEGEWLYLPDPYVSRRHAILTRIGGDKYAIEDTDSTSGTFVNGEAITERTTLEVGDTIKVGKLAMVFGDEITRGVTFLWKRTDSD